MPLNPIYRPRKHTSSGKSCIIILYRTVPASCYPLHCFNITLFARKVCLLKIHLLSPSSYFKLIFGFDACSSDPVNIYSLLSAPTSRQTSISIVHFVRTLVCAKTRKDRADTTRDATVRKDGLDTTAKSQRMRSLNSKSEGIIILLLWCSLFFSSLVWLES
jgi:hypothetical protein